MFLFKKIIGMCAKHKKQYLLYYIDGYNIYENKILCLFASYIG